MPLSVAVDAHNGLGAYGEDGTKHVAGRVKFAPETFDTPEGCAAYVVSLLMGAKCDGGEPQATVDRWPVRPSEWKARNESDAKQIKFVTEELEMDQIGWGRLCFKAAE